MLGRCIAVSNGPGTRGAYPDPGDRRRVRVEVTATFRDRAEEIWAPLAADWQRRLGARFTAAELGTIVDFLEHTRAIGAANLARLTDQS